jgi:hypothetical protein
MVEKRVKIESRQYADMVWRLNLYRAQINAYLREIGRAACCDDEYVSMRFVTPVKSLALIDFLLQASLRMCIPGNEVVALFG